MSEWKDKAVLEELYCEKGLTMPEVGEELGCHRSTVRRWLYHHGILDENSKTLPNTGDTRYRNKEFLIKRYKEENKTLDEIGEECGCDRHTVKRWMDKHGIDFEQGEILRRKSLNDPPVFATTQRGYEIVRHEYDDKRYIGRIHRLVAIAEHGIDVVSDKDVHHKNGIPWDNRPENLEPVTHSEHMSRHHSMGDFDEHLENLHEQMTEDTCPKCNSESWNDLRCPACGYVDPDAPKRV